MPLESADVVKILLAVAVGGMVGFEREFRDKAAGFRTLIFICLGSTLFTILSIKIAGFGDARLGGQGDATRIASNIVAGVGFLGAGVILREGGRVVGLTTAAAVWLVAALGMGIGASEHWLVLFVTAVTMVVLWVFPLLERWLDRVRRERAYDIVCPLGAGRLEALDRLILEQGLELVYRHPIKNGERVTYSCRVKGPPALHERLVATLLADPAVQELRY